MNRALSSCLEHWRAHSAGVSSPLELNALASCLLDLSAERVRRVLGIKLQMDTAHEQYAVRLWTTVDLQAQRRHMVLKTIPEVGSFVAELDDGCLYYGKVDGNVLDDVTVAQGLEFGENAAAREFERTYMPPARAQAEKFAGPRGVDLVDNLAADLVLPRQDRPPKIATFRGLTPLKSWLRSVVINRCVSSHRTQHEVSMNESHEIMGTDTVTSAVAAVECEEKLAPAFEKAVREIQIEDRVLLKMLILDGVPQKELAVAYGVDSGTLTRRRQRAGATLLEKIKQIGTVKQEPTGVRECLELLLAGESRPLQMRLASLLAVEIGDSLGPGGGAP